MKFPIIRISGGRKLIECRKKEFLLIRGYFTKPNLFHMKNAGKIENRTTAIIDSDGKFHEVIEGKMHRGWLRQIAGFVDLVTIDCTLTEGRKMTVSEVLLEAQKWKNNYARQFRKVLGKMDQDAIFDSKLFREAWEKNNMKLPEHEWGEDVFKK